MDVSTNPAFVIFASLSPLLIAFVKQSGFSTQVNAMLAFACYVIVGLLGMVLSGESLTWENAVNLIAVATVVGSAAYRLIWSQLGKSTDADPGFDAVLTEATSLKR